MASNRLARLLNGNPIGGKLADALETRFQNGQTSGAIRFLKPGANGRA